MRMLYRSASFIISLFMGDSLVFFDAYFEINEPMKFGLNKPTSKMTSGVCGSPDDNSSGFMVLF